jgi:hypothetical protein
VRILKRGSFNIVPENFNRGVGKGNRLEQAPTGDEKKRRRKKAKKRKRVKFYIRPKGVGAIHRPPPQIRLCVAGFMTRFVKNSLKIVPCAAKFIADSSPSVVMWRLESGGRRKLRQDRSHNG